MTTTAELGQQVMASQKSNPKLTTSEKPTTSSSENWTYMTF